MADLWETHREANRQSAEPLAYRMRPQRLAEFLGQEHFLGPGKLLRRMLDADRLTSVLFYGPPGTGKTTLAELIARYTRRDFHRANAAAAGVKEVRGVLDKARRRLEDDRVRTIFFFDEIHRFNRAQQDVLLSDVERGVITLIGATTENPFFAINSPLVSRSAIFQFEPLSEDHIMSLLRRAKDDPRCGYGQVDLRISEDALRHWATTCDGDARRALTALETAVLSSSRRLKETAEDVVEQDYRPDVAARDGEHTTPDPVLHAICIDLAAAEQSIQQKALVYDGTGDEHYDVVSAFIKSMRGSDPDASVYWLARMLEAGEDPRFIARRIAILASEDIGNADPKAIGVASAAQQITERIGMPECQLTLAQAAIYMATAPKSNASAQAIWDAMKDVKEGRTIPVPRHLRDGHYVGAKRLDHAQGYQYSHNADSGWVDQDYLGVEKTYYKPSTRGYEKQIDAYLKWIQDRRKR